MTDPAPLTFRDFASQIFSGELEAATSTLSSLLALPAERARIATEHFRGRTSDPTFLPKAMSLRTAVEGSDDGALEALLVDCFGLDDKLARVAALALRARYTRPA